MKKLIIAFCFAFVFLPSTVLANAGTFTDVSEGNQYFDAIQYAKDSGIVEGYADGYYKPAKEINRAEFLKILLETKYKTELELAVGSNCFEDIIGDEWFEKYVCYAKDIGVVNGYDDGTYKPSIEINRAEFTKIIIEATYDDLEINDCISSQNFYDLENLGQFVIYTP